MDVFYTLPPISRTIAIAAVAVSALGHLGFISLYPWVFVPHYVMQIPPHLWRMVSSFLITSPKLGIILDPYFFYIYSSQLERDSPRFSQPGDYFVYLTFVSAIIVVVSGFLFGAFTFISPLIVALAYSFSQQNPNASAHFVIFQIPAKYLPWALVFMTLVMQGPEAALQGFGGIVAGHAYEFLTRIWPEVGGGRNWIKTPTFIWKLFGGGTNQPRQRGAGVAYSGTAPPNTRAQQHSTSTGTNSGTSVFRGPGRRLG